MVYFYLSDSSIALKLRQHLFPQSNLATGKCLKLSQLENSSKLSLSRVIKCWFAYISFNQNYLMKYSCIFRYFVITKFETVELVNTTAGNVNFLLSQMWRSTFAIVSLRSSVKNFNNICFQVTLRHNKYFILVRT